VKSKLDIIFLRMNNHQQSLEMRLRKTAKKRELQRLRLKKRDRLRKIEKGN